MLLLLYNSSLLPKRFLYEEIPEVELLIPWVHTIIQPWEWIVIVVMRDFLADTPLSVYAQDLVVHQMIHSFSFSFPLLREFRPRRSLSDHLIISRKEIEPMEKKWVVQDDMISQCQIKTGPQVQWLSNHCSSHHPLDKWKNKMSLTGLVWASLLAQWWRICMPIQETWVPSLGQEDILEREMATRSSILAWEIPWTEESGRLEPMGLQRVSHDWAQHTAPGVVMLLPRVFQTHCFKEKKCDTVVFWWEI